MQTQCPLFIRSEHSQSAPSCSAEPPLGLISSYMNMHLPHDTCILVKASPKAPLPTWGSTDLPYIDLHSCCLSTSSCWQQIHAPIESDTLQHDWDIQSRVYCSSLLKYVDAIQEPNLSTQKRGYSTWSANQKKKKKRNGSLDSNKAKGKRLQACHS